MAPVIGQIIISDQAILEYTKKISLQDMIEQPRYCSFFWNTDNPVRAQPSFKLIIRRVLCQLLDGHDVEKTHGKVAPENIVVLNDDWDKAYLVNWNYSGTKLNDLITLGELLTTIFESTKGNASDYDCETAMFKDDLTNPRWKLAALRNHYWFKTATERCRMFIENVPKCLEYLKTGHHMTPSILGIPVSMSSTHFKQDTFLFETITSPKHKAVSYTVNLISSLQFLRSFYEHGTEKYVAEKLELELFHYYPTLMESVYKELIGLKIGNLFW